MRLGTFLAHSSQSFPKLFLNISSSEDILWNTNKINNEIIVISGARMSHPNGILWTSLSLTHEPSAVYQITSAVALRKKPVYDGWRTYEYGPVVISLWSLRRVTENVKCLPISRKHWSLIAAPITINTVPKKHMGERKIRLESLFGSRNVRTSWATVDFGVAPARITTNSMAACTQETYYRKSWDILIDSGYSSTNSYDSYYRMHIKDIIIYQYSLLLWRCWSGGVPSDVRAQCEKNDERYFD